MKNIRLEKNTAILPVIRDKRSGLFDIYFIFRFCNNLRKYFRKLIKIGKKVEIKMCTIIIDENDAKCWKYVKFIWQNH